MSNKEDCAAYFKANPAYDRCFQEFEKKWRTFGRVTGRICLKDCTEEEKRAIGGILGKVFYEDTIQFSFAEFEKGLQKTKFAPIKMRDVLEAYLGKTLSTNQEQIAGKRRRQEAFFDRIQEYADQMQGDRVEVCSWIQDMRAEKAHGYQLLLREYCRDEKTAEQVAKNVCDALLICEQLQASEEEMQLAVFAADRSGNPHYFDRGSAAGQLLVHAICYRQGTEIPKTAHQWREALLNAGIIADTISSLVHVYGLHLETEIGWHPAYEAFCRRKEPCVITLENLQKITGVKAEGNQVFIVENEMVFSYLVTALQETNVTILCTSGQPRTVAVKLLQLMADSGITMYYSGDLDPDGLLIADRLYTRFCENLRIWRMGMAEYEESISEEEISSLGIAKLQGIRHPELQKTAKVIAEKKCSGYQENVRTILLSDIQSKSGAKH